MLVGEGVVAADVDVAIPATVGSSLWSKLSVAPGAEQPTPAPTVPAAVCL